MKKNTIKLVVLALVFAFLANPQWNPLLTADMKEAAATKLQSTLGIFSGGALDPVNLLTALAVAILVYLITSVVCLLLTKACEGKNRSATVAGLITSIVKTVGFIAGVVWVLNVLGVDFVAIFASLGIASLIIGFGVQSLIEDCVTGVFLILEDQFNVGDTIVLGDFRGTVQQISVRTTTIKDDGGNVKIINNSDIRNVQNRSTALSLAVCDVGISYASNLPEVVKIIEAALPEIYERNKDIFCAVPVYKGVQSLADSAVVMRVLVEVDEKNVFPAVRRLNYEMKNLFDATGVEIPFPQVVVHQGK